MDWKLISEIPGYEDFTNYELNIAGDLRNRKTGRLRKWCASNGYYKATLSRGSIRGTIEQHIAICTLFKPNPDNKLCVDHKGRNSLDNSIDNLRWATYVENNQNRSISSRNTSGELDINKTTNHGKPVWRINIISHGQQHRAFFPRDPNSDVIPQKVIDKRNEMKRELHPFSN
jgi:hypothetical protein